MKITQLRNATIVIEAGEHRILVDPMLSPRGSLRTLKWLTRHRRRNPIVGMPDHSDQVLGRVTHGLITHCRHGHFDHLDAAGVEWLLAHDIPVTCMDVDAAWLGRKRLRTQVLPRGETSDFLGGAITPIPCRHGRGLVGMLMGRPWGYLIRWPGEPGLYLASDTVLTDGVKDFLAREQPEVSVIPAGGARLDVGGEILMGLEEAMEFGRLSEGSVVANHLEALDHCPVTRAALWEAAMENDLENRFLIPQDGETLVFRGAATP